VWRRLAQRRNAFDEPNEYRILRLVRDSSPISRTEISQRCALSKTTVTEIVGRFLDVGFLEPVGAGTSTSRGGRKRELLQFNPKAGTVFGVDIRMRSVQIVATDLNANILRRTTFPITPGDPPETVIGRTLEQLDSWRTSEPMLFEHSVGIGIGLPGVIDRESGIIRVADTLRGWQGTDLKRAFSERLGLSVFVENDVKAMTLAEFLFGAGKDVPDQVFFWVGDGIGAGIIVDGTILHGTTSSAGEIGYNEVGHILSRPDQFPLLYHGQRDLGGLLGDASLLRAYRHAGGEASLKTVEAVLAAARSSDHVASRVINEATTAIATICISIVNMLNPRSIILGGSIANDPSVARLVQQKLGKDLLSEPAKAVTVQPAQLGGDGVVLGAVGLVLYDLFKPSRANGVSMETKA
jgi:predicted NBD/HSP70 family sugar kinase